MSVFHRFVSAKANGPDATKVRPLDWNDPHDIIQILTNKSGVTVDAGTVVVQDIATAEAAKTTTTQGEQKLVFVAKATILNNATGNFYTRDVVDSIKVQNAVAIGQWLRTSVTAGRAEGIPIRTGTAYGQQGLPAGAFGIALTAFAGPGAGTVKAMLFGFTVAPIGYLGPNVNAAATLIVDASATVVKVTGQTPISTISGRFPGQVLTLLFTEPGFISTSGGNILLANRSNANVDALFPAGSSITLVCTGDVGASTHQELCRSVPSHHGRYVIREQFTSWAVHSTSLGQGNHLWQGNVGLVVTYAGAGRVTVTGPETAVLSDNNTGGGNKIFNTSSAAVLQCRQNQLGSTPGNRRFGFGSSATMGAYHTGEPTDGVYFRHALNGNIIAVCRSAGVETTVDTAIAAATPTEHDFAIAFDSGNARFYIDGVLKATITTNIPSVDMTIFFGCSAGTMQLTYISAEGNK